MKRCLVVLLFGLLPVPASAARHKRAEPWQDAVVTRFSDVPAGQNCSGTIDRSTDGGQTYDTSGGCQNVDVREWVLRFDGHRYTIEHREVAPGIYGAFFNRVNLNNVRLGQHVLAWIDGRIMHVKVGRKKATYDIVAAK